MATSAIRSGPPPPPRMHLGQTRLTQYPRVQVANIVHSSGTCGASATSATSGASAMSRQRARSATKWPILVHFSSAKNATSGASGQY